jgi:hypothetical protein
MDVLKAQEQALDGEELRRGAGALIFDPSA